MVSEIVTNFLVYCEKLNYNICTSAQKSNDKGEKGKADLKK